MLLSAVSVLVVAQSSLEIPEGLMNNPVYFLIYWGIKLLHLACEVPTNVSKFGKGLSCSETMDSLLLGLWF